MLCPHCRHSEGLHSGLGENGLTADGRLLAPDYEAGKCHQGECPCPGWYPDTTPLQRAAATLAARVERHKQLVEVPFALTRPVSQRKAKQKGLF